MAIHHILGKTLDGIRDTIGRDHELLDEVIATIKGIGVDIQDKGYDDYCKDALSGTASGTPVAGTINQIPGVPGDCHPMLVVLINGDVSEEMSFANSMRKLRSHLIHCSETQIAIVYTNVWNPDEFEESREDLLAHQQERNLRLVVMLSGDDSPRQKRVNLSEPAAS